MQRVVITGMGIISPIGNNIGEFCEGLKEGRCGIAPITRFDATNSKAKLAAEVKNFDPLLYYGSVLETRRADLFTQYAVGAACQAVEDSQIMGNICEERFGVYLGAGIGGISTLYEEAVNLREKGMRRVSSMFVPNVICNMAAGAVSIRFKAKGPSLPVVTACATSTNTIGEAYRAIRHGYADAILAGGAEAAITPLGIAGFLSCGALSLSENVEEGSIPFDLRRNGFVMGEGAAVLLLESLEHALSRNAKIYAEVAGYANTSDAYHITSPDPSAEGAARAISLAAQEAGVTGKEKIYVNTHGTSTKLNDKMETLAYKKAFGKDAYSMNFSSTKSMTGHMLGAAGAAEAVACVLALKEAFVPPTIHYRDSDPDCDLNYTPNQKINQRTDYAISSSFGFGGHNAVIVMKSFKE